MVDHHYVVVYRVEEGTQYRMETRKASTIMGVANLIAELQRAGHSVQRWHRVIMQDPTEKEERAMQTFLRMAQAKD